MSSIVTNTATAVQVSELLTITLQVRPTFTDQLKQAADRLSVVLTQFQNMEDPLSLKIFDWGVRAADAITVLTSTTQAVAEIRSSVIGKVEELKQRILTNPMNNAPLKVPYIDREWIWEKAELDEYLSFSVPSPYDGKLINAVPHEFAQGIIKWIASLSDLELGIELSAEESNVKASAASATVVAVPRKLSAEEVNLKIFLYMQNAQAFLRCQQLDQEAAMFTQMNTQLTELKDQTEARIQEEAQKAAEQATKHEASVNARLDSIESSNKERCALLQTQLNTSQQALNTAYGTIGSLSAQAASQQAQIADLNRKIHENTQKIIYIRKKSSSCVII